MERFRKIGVQPDAHHNGVWAVAPITHSDHSLGDFVSGGADGKLRSWRIKTDTQFEQEQQERDQEADGDVSDPCELLSVFKGHTLPIVDVAVAAKVPKAASTSLDGVVRIWNLEQPNAQSQTVQLPNLADSWGIAISSDGERIVTAGANGQVQVIDGSLGSVDQSMSIGPALSDGKDNTRRESAMVLSVALSEDDRHAAVGTQDGSVVRLDVESGKVIGTKLAKHGGPIRSISYLPGEAGTIVTGSDDQLVNLYDVDSGQVTGSCRGHGGLVLSVGGSPDGKYLVSGGSDRTVHVWDRVMKESVYSLKVHRDSVWGVTYAVNGSRIVSGGDDGWLSVLDSSKADIVG